MFGNAWLPRSEELMANDNKYVRLYPERAVAPLIEAARILVGRTNTFGNLPSAAQMAGMLQEALKAVDTLGFPPDEPLFLLRGQDVLAPWAVQRYASDVAMSEAFGGKLSPSQVDTIHHLEEFADRMAAWEPRKNPD
jgi:hypothetical protein